MGMFDWILAVRRADSDLARQIVVDSQASVWQRIAPRAGLLTSLPETQGYIQARAKSAVRSKLATVAPGNSKLSAERRRQVLTRALATLAEQFSAPMLDAHSAVTPVRRAA